MVKTKTLVIGAFMICLAVLFQIIPVIFSEVLVAMTVLSAIPIYIICRLDPKLGLVGFIGAALLIMLFSIHEAMMFIFTNGVIGLSLGVISNYTSKRLVIITISSLILTITLIVLNFAIGIPVFGLTLPNSFFLNAIILLLFSLAYCTFYYLVVSYIYKRLEKWKSL